MESQKGFAPLSKSLLLRLVTGFSLPCEPSGPFGPFGLSVVSRLLSCLYCSLRRGEAGDRHAER